MAPVARRADVAASSPISASSWEGAPIAGAELERALRRSLGSTAWAVMADLYLDAAPNGAGPPVVATSARRVAAHLGIAKDTAARALRRLSAAGIVRRCPQGTSVTGHFTRGSYELLLVRGTGTPCRPDEDTVPVARLNAADTDHAAAPGPARRRKRRSVGSQPGQLSLLDRPPIDGDAGHSR